MIKINNLDFDSVICINKVATKKYWTWIVTILSVLFSFLIPVFTEMPILGILYLCVLIFGSIKLFTSKTRFYLAVDEYKTLYGYTLINNNLKIEFSYSNIDIAQIDIFNNTTIRLFGFNNANNTEINLSILLSKRTLTKLKIILLKYYPDKVPVSWHSDKDVKIYIENGTLPSPIIPNQIVFFTGLVTFFAIIIALVESLK